MPMYTGFFATPSEPCDLWRECVLCWITGEGGRDVALPPSLCCRTVAPPKTSTAPVQQPLARTGSWGRGTWSADTFFFLHIASLGCDPGIGSVGSSFVAVATVAVSPTGW